MKLNGALKPRQGASKQGSSPGDVLRRYRIKRYYKVNENVVKGLPLNKCGVNNTNIIENISNSYINNQQQLPQLQTAPQIQQQQENKCGKAISRNSSSLSSKKEIIKKNIKQSKSETPNTTKNIVSAVIGTAIKAKDNNQGASIYNITTRLINNTKINKENKNNTSYSRRSNIHNNNNNNNNNKDVKKTEQAKVVKTTSNTPKYHVIVNRNHNNNNNNSNSNNSYKNNINNTICGGNICYKEVNNFLLYFPKINANSNLIVIILRFFIHLKLLLLFTFSHVIKPYLTGNLFVRFSCGGGYSADAAIDCYTFSLVNYKLAKIMRASPSLEGSFERTFIKNFNKTRVPPSIALCVLVYAVAAIFLPQPVAGDDGDNFFPVNGIETPTPEFDYASRGQKKFGDKCENTLECGFPGSICDPKKKSCQCTEDLPVTNHIDKCGKEAAVNESCFFNEQCEVKYFQTECRDQKCVCRFDMTPVWLKDGSVECKGRGDKKGPETYIDPAMIGVLIGMALMFIIICVVLRLFSQARWRENRTIFNTPNPRLMNVSLLRESKLLHGQERRGSRMSVRAPSRQPSMASLRPHSPNPSLGKTGSRSNSHGSNASATSLRSTRSNSVSPAGIIVNNSHHERKGSTYQPHQHQHSQQKPQQQQTLLQQEQQPLTQTNIISNPVAETVTVEIIEPEK